MILQIVALCVAAFTIGQMFSVMLEWNLHRKDK